MATFIEASEILDHGLARRAYQKPRLIAYGFVAVLTKSGSSGNLETNPGCSTGQPNFVRPCPPPSDARYKHNIVRMGTHPSGVGLYLYDYLPEFANRAGTGKFFGVMAQEVLLHNPDAVVIDAWGYYGVNYAALESGAAQ